MQARLNIVLPFAVALERPTAPAKDLMMAHANAVEAGVVICAGIVDVAVERSIDRAAAAHYWVSLTILLDINKVDDDATQKPEDTQAVINMVIDLDSDRPHQSLQGEARLTDMPEANQLRFQATPESLMINVQLASP